MSYCHVAEYSRISMITARNEAEDNPGNTGSRIAFNCTVAGGRPSIDMTISGKTIRRKEKKRFQIFRFTESLLFETFPVSP
jgi:hypothetical protein